MSRHSYRHRKQIAGKLATEGGDGDRTRYGQRRRRPGAASAKGDSEAARRHFETAMPTIEQLVREHPKSARQHARLSLLYAYLHRNEDALRESMQAVELEPESENAFHGVTYSVNLALVYAWIGQPDKALTLVERLLRTPGGANYPGEVISMTLAELRLRWEWDPLRDNPRFQTILANPEPKTVY